MPFAAGHLSVALTRRTPVRGPPIDFIGAWHEVPEENHYEDQVREEFMH